MWALRVGLALIVLLAALAGLVWGVGRSLPVAHTARVSGTVSAPPEDVWAAVVGVDDFPEWRPEVESVERLDGPDAGEGELVGWRERGRDGTLTFAVDEWEPPARLVARIADEGLPFGGRWIYELEPAPAGGTRVTLTEEGEVYDPIFRFFSRFVFGHDGTLRQYLEVLRARFGEGAS